MGIWSELSSTHSGSPRKSFPPRLSPPLWLSFLLLFLLFLLPLPPSPPLPSPPRCQIRTWSLPKLSSQEIPRDSGVFHFCAVLRNGEITYIPHHLPKHRESSLRPAQVGRLCQNCSGGCKGVLQGYTMLPFVAYFFAFKCELVTAHKH